MPFPIDRPRRLRRNEAMRSFVRETRLSPEGFVYPLFVCPGKGVRSEIHAMPDCFRLSVDETVAEGLITLEGVRVLRYRHNEAKPRP